MTLVELREALKAVSDYDKATGAIFRGLKEQKEVILDMNKDQLFNKSIGADETPLGWYSNSFYNGELGRAGMPYTMVDSGLFRDGMYIEFYYRTITIRSEYHTYEMQQSGNFQTDEFFGLTDDNFIILIEEYVQPILLEWMRSVLEAGGPVNMVSAGVV